MTMIEERLEATKNELARATLNGEKSIVIDINTAELLVEGFTELWEINKEDRARADEKYRRAMEKKFLQRDKIQAHLERQSEKYRRAMDENRNLKQRVASFEKREMQRTNKLLDAASRKGESSEN